MKNLCFVAVVLTRILVMLHLWNYVHSLHKCVAIIYAEVCTLLLHAYIHVCSKVQSLVMSSLL